MLFLTKHKPKQQKTLTGFETLNSLWLAFLKDCMNPSKVMLQWFGINF